MSEHPTDRPAVLVEQITDFDRLSELFVKMKGSIEQLSRGCLKGNIQVVRGGLVRAYLGEVNQSIRIRGLEESDMCTVAPITSGGAGSLWHARQLEPGSVVTRGGDVEINHITSQNTSSPILMIPEAELRAAAQAVSHAEIGSIGWQALRPAPEAFARLESVLRQFLAEATGPWAPSLDDLHALEQDCLVAAIQVLDHATVHRIDLALPARAHLVRRAEDFMRSRLEGRLGEVDLCRELGASGRTLRQAFHERFGFGPLDYFRILRLNATRETLKAADPGDTSVATVARRFGFSHLGKFAGYYRRQFDELPSTTLARKSG